MTLKEKLDLLRSLDNFLGEDRFFATHGDGYCYLSSFREIEGSMAWGISINKAIKMGIPSWIMEKIRK